MTPPLHSVSTPAVPRHASSLHRRFLVSVGISGAAAIVLLAWGANAAFTAVAARDGGLRDAQVGILIGVTLLLVALSALLAVLHHFLSRRISRPATELAEAAEAVAAGDFSVQLRRSSSDDEMGRLTRAVGAMIVELRRLGLVA